MDRTVEPLLVQAEPPMELMRTSARVRSVWS